MVFYGGFVFVNVTSSYSWQKIVIFHCSTDKSSFFWVFLCPFYEISSAWSVYSSYHLKVSEFIVRRFWNYPKLRFFLFVQLDYLLVWKDLTRLKMSQNYWSLFRSIWRAVSFIHFVVTQRSSNASFDEQLPLFSMSKKNNKM